MYMYILRHTLFNIHVTLIKLHFIKTFSTDSSPPKLYFMYGNLFIGGIPSDYMNLPGGPVTSKTFAGCFGDTIMNGVLLNFAATIDKYSEKLHKCSAGGILAEKSKIVLPVNGKKSKYNINLNPAIYETKGTN